MKSSYSSLNLPDYQEHYFNALISGDHQECSRLSNQFISQTNDVKFLYEEVFKPSLYKVGRLWEQNKISVATEHMASSIVEANLNELYPNIVNSIRNNKTAIVTCIENEFHQIGVKMVGDIFELNGWNVHFLGANTPTNDLLSFIGTIKPHIVGISLSIYFHLPTLEIVLDRITSEYPDLKVLVGGQAFQHGGLDVFAKYPSAIFKKDLNETSEFISNL